MQEMALPEPKTWGIQAISWGFRGAIPPLYHQGLGCEKPQILLPQCYFALAFVDDMTMLGALGRDWKLNSQLMMKLTLFVCTRRLWFVPSYASNHEW
jgi:hypothetical protein